MRNSASSRIADVAPWIEAAEGRAVHDLALVLHEQHGTRDQAAPDLALDHRVKLLQCRSVHRGASFGGVNRAVGARISSRPSG